MIFVAGETGRIYDVQRVFVVSDQGSSREVGVDLNNTTRGADTLFRVKFASVPTTRPSS